MPRGQAVLAQGVWRAAGLAADLLRMRRRSVDGGGGGLGGGQVRFRCTFHNTIYDVFRARGWQETDSDTDWDVAWVDTGWLRENFDSMHLSEHQRLNHFRNHYELTRKDNLIKNLKRTQRTLQREGKAFELHVMIGHGHGCAESKYGSRKRLGYIADHLFS